MTVCAPGDESNDSSTWAAFSAAAFSREIRAIRASAASASPRQRRELVSSAYTRALAASNA